MGPDEHGSRQQQEGVACDNGGEMTPAFRGQIGGHRQEDRGGA